MAWYSDNPDPDIIGQMNDELNREHEMTEQNSIDTTEIIEESRLLRTGIRPEFVVVRDGRQFVLYAGLLDLAHRIGLIGIATTLVQSPVGPHYTAIVHARASKLVPPDGELPARIETYDGIGDANEANTSRVIGVHQIRLAETRAKARALRDLTNVGVAALEELGGEPVGVGPIRVVAGPAAPPPPADPVTFAPAPTGDRATDKQRWLVLKLLNEQGLSALSSSYDTKAQAKDLIDQLIKKTYTPGGAR